MASGIVSNLRCALLFASGAIFGGLVVQFLVPDPHGENGAGDTGSSRRLTAIVPGAQGGGGRGDGRDRGIEPATDQIEAVLQISDALRARDPIERSRAFIAVLELMNESNGEIYLDAWLQFLKENTANGAQGTMMNRRLGQVLGEKVVGTRIGTKTEMNAAHSWMKDQLHGWMDTDPEASWEWLDGLENEAFRERMIGVYLQAVSLDDTEHVVSVLKSVPDDLQSSYGRQVVSALRSSKSAEEVSDWISSQEQNEDGTAPTWLKAATSALLRGAADARNPGGSVARIFERHLGQPGLDLNFGKTAARKYSQQEPAAGLEWAASMAARPEFNGELAIIGSAVDGIPQDRLVETASGIALPAESVERDTALNRIALRLSKSDPAQAAIVAALIHDPALVPELPLNE